VAVTVSATLRAAETNDVDLEGYLVPPGAHARLELRRSPGSPAVPPPSAPGQSLALVWIDGAGAAAGSERPARDEAVRLLRAMGVDAAWRTGSPAGTTRPGEVRVIFLDRGAVDRRGAPVLGSTPSRFEGEPFFWVHVPSIRGALGLDPRRTLGLADLRDRHLLGIALGRVIAHETVHALAPGIPHGAGLMAPLLKRGDLTSKGLRVPTALGEAFLAALAGRTIPSAADAGGSRLLTVGVERDDR